MKLRPCIFALLGLVAALVFVEGALRIANLYEHVELAYDRATGLITYVPSSTYRSQGACYDHPAPINALGLYGPEVAPRKEDGVFRILVVGSSFVEGMQVTLPERFDTLLEERLNARSPGRFEVAALGFPANGTYLNLLYYQEYFASLDADLVIDLMTDFDLGKDAPTATVPPRFTDAGEVILEVPETRRNDFVIAVKSALRQSRLFEALYQRYLAVRAAIYEHRHTDAIATTTEDRITFEASWGTEALLLREFQKIVERDERTRFALASWTTAAHEDRDYVGRELRPITKELGIPYLDLAPSLEEQERASGKSAMLPCDGHWGAEGHRFVAAALEELLRDKRLIPR